MNFTVVELDEVSMLRFAPSRLDLTNAEALKKAVTALLDQKKNHILFNLFGINFMDSSGLAALLFCRNKLSKGKMALCCVNTRVLNLLKLSRLDHGIFSVFEEEEEALAFLRS